MRTPSIPPKVSSFPHKAKPSWQQGSGRHMRWPGGDFAMSPSPPARAQRDRHSQTCPRCPNLPRDRINTLRIYTGPSQPTTTEYFGIKLHKGSARRTTE